MVSIRIYKKKNRLCWRDFYFYSSDLSTKSLNVTSVSDMAGHMQWLHGIHITKIKNKHLQITLFTMTQIMINKFFFWRRSILRRSAVMKCYVVTVDAAPVTVYKLHCQSIVGCESCWTCCFCCCDFVSVYI